MLWNRVIKLEKGMIKGKYVNGEPLLIMHVCDCALQTNTLPASAGAGGTAEGHRRPRSCFAPHISPVISVLNPQHAPCTWKMCPTDHCFSSEQNPRGIAFEYMGNFSSF